MRVLSFLLTATCCVSLLLTGPGCGREESPPAENDAARKEPQRQEGSSGYMETLTKTYKEGREEPHLLSVRNDLKQFHAMKGRWPRSLDEFTEWRGADLPELPEGRRFQYDPGTGDLRIVKAEKE